MRQKQNARLHLIDRQRSTVWWHNATSTFQDSETRPSDYWACQDQLPHRNQPRVAVLNETKMMAQVPCFMH